MQRRLEDVSHFFFDPRNALYQDSRPSREVSRATRRSRIVHVAGSGDHVTSAMVVAGLALGANRRGQRVLAAETHEHSLGVAFALEALRIEGGSMVETVSDLWVSLAPLLGTRRPGVVFDQRAIAAWEAKVTQADVVLIHVSRPGGDIRGAGLSTPDECLFVVGESVRDDSPLLYRAIKRMLSWNPSVEVGVIRVSQRDTGRGAPVKLAHAVETFLGRPCPVVGAISGAALAQAVCSDAGWRAGREELVRALSTIAGRWETPKGRTRQSDDLTAEESAFFRNG